MRIWWKLVATAVAPLLLGGCLWGPGKFTSTLALNKAGTFVLDYRGEIMLQNPDDKSAASGQWTDDKARCFRSGVVTVDGVTVSAPNSVPTADDDHEAGDPDRPCTGDELERARIGYEEKAEHKRKENEEMAKLFGMPGSDDASNRRFAANLMKQQGWKSVTYRGKGVFDVDYHFEGRLNQDYVFPLMPEADLMIPFITIRPRIDGSVKINAPAFTGKSGPFGARAKSMGLPDKGSEGPASRAEGRFTVTTDGEILTNNSEDGPVAVQGRRQLHWDVDAGSDKVPEMMVRL